MEFGLGVWEGILYGGGEGGGGSGIVTAKNTEYWSRQDGRTDGRTDRRE